MTIVRVRDGSRTTLAGPAELDGLGPSDTIAVTGVDDLYKVSGRWAVSIGCAVLRGVTVLQT